MWAKLCKSSPVKNILVISLSNIGDVILTCPVIDVLLKDFPQARLNLVIGPKAKTLFLGHPRIESIIYDKQLAWQDQARWFLALRQQRFDLVVDLRQTALPVFLPSRWRTSLAASPADGHMRHKHFHRLQAIYPDAELSPERLAIVPKSVAAVAGLSGYVVIAPGAADSAKRWPPGGFARLADTLAAQGRRVVFVGDRQDSAIVSEIQKQMKQASLSLAGQADLRELAFVLQRAKMVLTHDSAVSHLASYLNVPVAVLWGPTDRNKYGPWSGKSEVVYRGKNMGSIQVEDALNGLRRLG